MKKLISLVKVQLKDIFSSSKKSMNISDKPWALGAAVLFILWLWGLYIRTSLRIYIGFNQAGQPEAAIFLIYISSLIVMFIVGIPRILSIFFYSKDTEFLVTLPINEGNIIYAKLISVYINLVTLVSLFVLAPIIVIHNIYQGVTFLTILFGLAGLILAPLLPLLVSSLLILPLSRLLAGSRWRNILNIIGGFLMIGVVLLIQRFIYGIMGSSEELNRLVGQGEIIRKLGNSLPVSVWFTEMVQGSVSSFLLFLALNLVLILVLNMVGHKLYRKALYSYNQNQSTGQGHIYYQKRSIGLQLIKRHIKIILSEPTFALNILSTMFFPIIWVVAASFSGNFSLKSLAGPGVRPYLPLIFGLGISLVLLSSQVASTVINREGKRFWETKTLPISSWDNLRYMMISSVILHFVGAVIMSVLASFFIPLSLKVILLGGLLHISINLAFSALDVINNIRYPHLEWTNPSGVNSGFVSNIVSIIPKVGSIIVITILYQVLIRFGVDLFTLILTGIFALTYLLARNRLKNHYVDKFNQIEV